MSRGEEDGREDEVHKLILLYLLTDCSRNLSW